MAIELPILVQVKVYDIKLIPLVLKAFQLVLSLKPQRNVNAFITTFETNLQKNSVFWIFIIPNIRALIKHTENDACTYLQALSYLIFHIA